MKALWMQSVKMLHCKGMTEMGTSVFIDLGRVNCGIFCQPGAGNMCLSLCGLNLV